MRNSKELETESARLQTLLQYKVLDTLPEIEYDDITYLASLICETPVALVSLSDENRQWFKSKIGVSDSQIPREGSFCNTVVLDRQPMTIPDSLKDPRFAKSVFVAEAPHFRFYAGAPIIAPNGHVLGTVCVLDQKPRELSEKQLLSLQALARQVAGQLEVRKAHFEIRHQFEQLQDSSRKIFRQEATLIHSAKMSTLGEMASGVAHEINNPLAIILGYNQIILEWARVGTLEAEKVLELGERIETTGKRIAKIISNLRAFSRDGRNDPFTVIKVEEIVAQVVGFSQARFKSHRIQLTIGEVPEGLSIYCQQVQVSQVLFNLLSNAHDAVLDRDMRWVRLDVLDQGGMVSFVVTDSGPGIATDLQKNLMQPFFTTKPVGKGAGLGLSVANGIVQSHGGCLSLDVHHTNTRFVASFPKNANVLRKPEAA